MRRITLFLALMLAIIIVPGVVLAATATVTTQEQFVENVEKGNAVTTSKDITIKLEKDLTMSQKVTINNKVTLDLNGHTIKLDGSSAQFFIQSKGTLIIKDSAGNGLITNAGATSYNQYPIQILGNCQVEGGTLENALPNLKTVYIQNATSTCTLNGGTIKNSYEKGGRAIYSGKGTFIMNGGKVENKAAGSDGLVPAIEGGAVKMTGGTIEAAGTGIQSSNLNVNITGGTIKAGWFGLHTSNVTIKPEEGKTVNITVPTPETERKAALFITYNKLKTGEGNEIYGGNFEAPMFMETGYVCYPDNMQIYGGTFTHEVPVQNIAPGYLVNKVGDKYKVELNTPSFVDDDLKEDNEVEMGVVPELKEKLEEVFKKEINENQKIQDALLDGKSVNIHIQIEKVEEKDVKEEELKEIQETAKDKKLAKFYDITLVVKADNSQIDTVSETSSKLKFKVLIPEDLLKDNRTFFMYRYHNGEVKEISGEVTEDNYFVFESDRFSTYVLAYEDKVEEQPEQDNTGNEGTVTPPDEDDSGNEGTVTPPAGDNLGKDEAEQQPEQDNTDKEETITPPTEGEEEQQPEVKPTTPDVPKTGDNVVLYVALAVLAVMGILRVKKLNVKTRKH